MLLLLHLSVELVALVTLVDVLGESRSLLESLVAVLARVWETVGVSVHMLKEVNLFCKLFGTKSARERLSLLVE